MSQQTILTGITPSGTAHIGNYIGAIKPAIESQNDACQNIYFIADYHSLVKLWDAKARGQHIYDIAATWLALGLDPDKTIFFRQSDVPEVMELTWILTSVASKGLLNRAHAYKDKVAKNIEDKQDPDASITMGLYCYPVLMAADILAFNAHKVPVGKDQIQHLEIARDLAARFNHIYQQELFVLPEAVVDKNTQTILGLDGRKMSKSYNNTIPIFSTSKQLRKAVMKIVTNSQPPEEPKDPNNCTVFSIYQAIASGKDVETLRQRYLTGIGWGDAKQTLFEALDTLLNEPRERYDALINNTAELDKILAAGAAKARAIARPILQQARKIIGINR